MQNALRRTFASLAVRNFRLYFFGQGISLCGTWVRIVALSWLVLQLTHSGTQLGLVTAAQFVPILLLGAFGGVIVDRTDNKRLLVYTQIGLGLISLALGLLIVTHAVQLWMVYGLSVLTGLITVLDSPARQTFVVQMVGESQLKNAVSLNSTIVNVARVVGPSIAAILIATIGIGLCFIVDAGTFGAVLVGLFLMRRGELLTFKPAPKQSGQLVEGLCYAWATPELRTTLLMMVVIGTFAYEFPVTLPLLATNTFHGSATDYSLMTVAMGIGAIAGGLFTAGRAATQISVMIIVAALFGVGLIVTGLAPSLKIALVFFVVLGVLSVLFISLGNTILQLVSVPQMRGRVMSLWSIAFQGTTPIGGPIVGAIADHTNPRVGLLVGGVATIVAACIGAGVAGYRLPKRGGVDLPSS